MTHHWTEANTRHLSTIGRLLQIRIVQAGDLSDCAPVLAQPADYEDATVLTPADESAALLAGDAWLPRDWPTRVEPHRG